MSIQPNRVLHRIVSQVDRSCWPRLDFSVLEAREPGELVRLYRTKDTSRYATPVHFWVHALRDELTTRDRRQDLVGAGGHALCREWSVARWSAELEACLGSDSPATRALRSLVGQIGTPARGYRMLESACRRSSVVEGEDGWVADFWGHGLDESWRMGTIR